MKRLALFLVVGIFILVPTLGSAEPKTLYDWQTNQFKSYGYQKFGNQSTIYDYQNNTFSRGSTYGDRTTIFDYGTRSFYDLNQTSPNTFSGFDYGTSTFQDYTVDPYGGVTLFDYGTGEFSYFDVYP